MNRDNLIEDLRILFSCEGTDSERRAAYDRCLLNYDNKRSNKPAEESSGEHSREGDEFHDRYGTHKRYENGRWEPIYDDWNDPCR